MMGVCETGVLCCPDWIMSLAVVGGVLIYALMGMLIFLIVKAFKDDLEWDYVILFIFLWPFIIVVAVVLAVVYYISRLIAMPIVGADKHDLRQLERKMENKITREDNKIMNYLEYEYKPPKKKVVKTKTKKKVKRK